MINKYYLNALAIALILLVASCSNEQEPLGYYAFKVSQGDKWGVVDGRGNFIVEDEFSNQPFNICNDIFFVANNDGMINMYSTKEPTKEIDVNFKQIATFADDITPSVKKGECIKYIDKKGNVAFELPSDCKRAMQFIYGWSPVFYGSISTIDKLVDKKGQFFEPTKYTLRSVVANDVFLAEKENKFYLINQKEEELFGFSDDFAGVSFTEDLKYYIFKDAGSYGLKSIDGEVVLPAKYKELQLSDNYLIFSSNKDYYGIMDLKGDVVIKEKYKQIYSVKNKMFIASRESNEEMGLLNFDEDKLMKFDYSALFFIPGTDNLYAQKKGEKTICIVNKNGEPISKKAEFCNLEILSEKTFENIVVESDFYDTQAVINSLLMPSSDKTFLNMFGCIGKTPDKVLDMWDLDYIDERFFELDRSSNTSYFPYKECSTDDWEIQYRVGFDEILKYTVYEDDYDIEVNNTNKPKEFYVEGTLSRQNRQHWDDIIDCLDDYFKNKSFEKQGEYVYSNSDLKIGFIFIKDSYKIGYWVFPKK